MAKKKQKKVYTAPALTNLKTVTQCSSGKGFTPDDPPIEGEKF